jgi:hypothetical protein
MVRFAGAEKQEIAAAKLVRLVARWNGNRAKVVRARQTKSLGIYL